MRRVAMSGWLLVLGILGCGEAGPTRMQLSGTATFDGNPIPFGDIVLTPDGAKGNSGTQGIAPIRDGKYDTAWSDGKGFAGGPTVIRVTGLTGPGGKLLCDYEYKADLPREPNGTFDVVVPGKGKITKGSGKEI